MQDPIKEEEEKNILQTTITQETSLKQYTNEGNNNHIEHIKNKTTKKIYDIHAFVIYILLLMYCNRKYLDYFEKLTMKDIDILKYLAAFIVIFTCIFTVRAYIRKAMVYNTYVSSVILIVSVPLLAGVCICFKTMPLIENIVANMTSLTIYLSLFVLAALFAMIMLYIFTPKRARYIQNMFKIVFIFYEIDNIILDLCVLIALAILFGLFVAEYQYKIFNSNLTMIEYIIQIIFYKWSLFNILYGSRLFLISYLYKSVKCKKSVWHAFKSCCFHIGSICFAGFVLPISQILNFTSYIEIKESDKGFIEFCKSANNAYIRFMDVLTAGFISKNATFTFFYLVTDNVGLNGAAKMSNALSNKYMISKLQNRNNLLVAIVPIIGFISYGIKFLVAQYDKSAELDLLIAFTSMVFMLLFIDTLYTCLNAVLFFFSEKSDIMKHQWPQCCQLFINEGIHEDFMALPENSTTIDIETQTICVKEAKEECELSASAAENSQQDENLQPKPNPNITKN
ncbi:hypothetical protein EDEG_01605 [Edhazardia aedis USNM 41457]|uniref:Uncharacterized protein n=1 Tax=Edhazardia aedis (strain USNM 41457) TaxID=1003232 RepID=J8ZWQ4_EDHAE|nr:hypothetical protein EDEG_01605 [Edhazardia aedis USNM 41457]|eukprot:EJW04083.1 hypothetical protein EDEG_01605 [Edhazardia aedis USNM 41457]